MENMQLAYKDNLKFGDVIVVYNPQSLLHKLIGLITKEQKFKAGHVAMSYYDNIVEAGSRGVDVKQYKDYSPKHHIYVVRPMQDITMYQRLPMEEYISDKMGEEYSFFQLPVIALKYILHLKRTIDVSRKAVICSELIAGCYEKAGIAVSTKEPSDTAPVDFLISSNFRLVFMHKPGLVTKFYGIKD